MTRARTLRPDSPHITNYAPSKGEDGEADMNDKQPTEILAEIKEAYPLSQAARHSEVCHKHHYICAMAFLIAEVEKLHALDLCSVCGNAPLASGKGCVCAGTGTADGERHGLRIEAIRAQQEADNLQMDVIWHKDRRINEFHALNRTVNERDGLREACKKALTCASLDSSVRALISVALSGDAGEGK
jgi:hypothetical protein